MAVRAKVAGEDEDEDVAAQKFLDAVIQLNHDLAIPTHLAALKEGDIRVLAKAACKEAETGYPVPRYMTLEQCEAIIRKVLPPQGAAARDEAPAARPARKRAAAAKAAPKPAAKSAAKSARPPAKPATKARAAAKRST
jgi:alcohol dehydrogenase